MNKASFLEAMEGRASAVVSDVGSECGEQQPLTLDEQDSARRQHDQVLLARVAVQQQEQEYATIEGEESDAEDGYSSPSSEDEKLVARTEARARAYGEMADVAARVARISSMQMANMYRKGRTVRSGPRIGDEVDQRVFGLEGTIALQELETAAGLYDQLLQGQNVMAQYVARTGIGKTTKLPALIAKKCGMRVLLLEPDMLLARAAANAQRESTRVRDSWSKKRQEQLTVMTYADFCAQFYVKNGILMVQQFDVIIMDEAHFPMAEVYAAKALLATYGRPDVSLLVLSATLEGDETQAVNGAPKMQTIRGDMLAAIKAGRFSAGPRCRDRTMLLLPTDEQVAEARAVLVEAGHTAYTLDSASRDGDRDSVCDILKQQSMVKRFLIATEKFGTGHSFPISGVYTSMSRRVYVMNEETRAVEARIEPIMSAEVKQHGGRVNRGLAQGNQSYCYDGVGEAKPDMELLPSEKLRAYLILRAAGVRPLTNMCPPRGFFPFGITPAVASDVLAINMPCELAIRFFNRDGRLSTNYARALSPFSQVQHYFVTSPLEGPIGADKWIKVPIGGYYGSAIQSDAMLAVPFDVEESELRVKLHAVCAFAAGRIVVPGDFVPQMSDSDVSGDEQQPEIVRGGARLPRLVTTGQRPPRVPPKEIAWGFAAEIEGQMGFAGSRTGMLGGDSYTQATLRALREASDSVRAVPENAVVDAVDRHGVSRVQVMSDVVTERSPATPVEVLTPGGTVVVTLRKSAWERLIQGLPLDSRQFYSLLYHVKDNIQGFVRSAAFANWSNVWLGILDTCADLEVVQYVARRALSPVLTALLHAMYVKYTQGVQNVTQVSYTKAKFWGRILRGRSLDEQLKRDRDHGKVEVMQSEAFFRRVYDIRKRTAVAIRTLESAGVFMPQTVADVQGVLPMADRTGVGVADRVMHESRSVLPYRREHSRRRSGGSSTRSAMSYQSRF